MGDNWETQKHMSNEKRHMVKMSSTSKTTKGYLSTMPKMKYRPSLTRVGETPVNAGIGQPAQKTIKK